MTGFKGVSTVDGTDCNEDARFHDWDFSNSMIKGNVDYLPSLSNRIAYLL